MTRETGTDPDHPGRWRMLALVAAAELLGMSLWFAATAVAAQLRQVWNLDVAQAGWLTTVVQLGFVVGTAVAALLNLADLVPARGYFAASALLAAAANAAVIVCPGVREALACRFLTGFFLAGVYPPGMKMIATWFRAYRGLAIGIVVGAISLGKATPYLVHAISTAGVAPVLATASLGATLGALLIAAGYRDGPYPFPRRPFSWKLVAAVVRHRETRLATGGYLGHMWELYAMWTWIPVFLGASFAARASLGLPTPGERVVDWLAFGGIAIGSLGCVWGGWAAQRHGYARVVTWAMVASGACSLAIGLSYGASQWILVPLAWCWGFFVVADSAQFSAMVTEVAPPHAVGTALTLQTSMGFLLTMATIQLVPAIAGAIGWRWAFAILALGPAAGIAAIQRLGAGSRGPAAAAAGRP